MALIVRSLAATMENDIIVLRVVFLTAMTSATQAKGEVVSFKAEDSCE